MLNLEFVKKIINTELDPRIKDARDMSDKLKLHIDGIGLQSYLAKINNYENEKQFDARKKHAVSNKFLTENLLRPVDNAFNARGGSKHYKFKTDSESKTDEFIKKLTNVKDNSSLSDYIENVWFNKYITDPNGLILMEVKDEDEYGDKLPEDEKTIQPCYKSIHSIRAYEQNGLFVDWVIFEPHSIIVDIDDPNNKEKNIEIFWAVDSEYYYKFKKSKEGVVLFDDPIENSFEQVPAILCSNIIDSVTGWKKSSIDSQVELLDKYLVSNSVLSIAEFFHNYLQQWTYIDTCSKCNGTGTVGNNDDNCPVCEGTGKAQRKDVTDIIELKIPDADQVKIDPPAGFIYAPTDAWEGMINTVDRLNNIIEFSHWGTNQEKGESETATGRYIDVQPVHNRLDKYSKSIEMAHTALANFIGSFYFPETFEKAYVQYGRRYLIETPDQIWEKYIKSKVENAPVSTLDLLLSQFLESEFRENEQLLRYELKKVQLEPFVHWDIVTVKSLGVGNSDYNNKLYFSDWIQTKTLKEVIDTDLDKLNKELTTYANNKNINLNNNNNGSE